MARSSRGVTSTFDMFSGNLGVSPSGIDILMEEDWQLSFTVFEGVIWNRFVMEAYVERDNVRKETLLEFACSGDSRVAE